MKPAAISLLLAPPLAAQLVPLGEHLDVRSHYVAGSWTNVLRVGNVDYNPAGAFLPLSDKPLVNGAPAISGARQTQPSSAAFAFTGAAPGEPIWTAVQGTPGAGEVWPGFDNDQPAGTFGSYIPDDARVSQLNPRPWIKVSLVDYRPPAGKESHFSMWNTSAGQPPSVWMSTADPTVDDAFFHAEGSHVHVWWGFTALGIHRLSFSSSAFLGPGASNPTGAGEPFTLTFAVGTVARWQASWFDAAELGDPEVSGLEADPDGDGLSNLVEYAFGTDPRSGGPVPVEEGLGLPVFSLVEEDGELFEVLSYPRRRAGERLLPEVYEPLFSDDIGSGWSSSGVETTATDFPPPLDQLNTEWELATSRRPATSGRGFARVSVEAGDGF